MKKINVIIFMIICSINLVACKSDKPYESIETDTVSEIANKDATLQLQLFLGYDTGQKEYINTLGDVGIFNPEDRFKGGVQGYYKNKPDDSQVVDSEMLPYIPHVYEQILEPARGEIDEYFENNQQKAVDYYIDNKDAESTDVTEWFSPNIAIDAYDGTYYFEISSVLAKIDVQKETGYLGERYTAHEIIKNDESEGKEVRLYANAVELHFYGKFINKSDTVNYVVEEKDNSDGREYSLEKLKDAVENSDYSHAEIIYCKGDDTVTRYDDKDGNGYFMTLRSDNVEAYTIATFNNGHSYIADSQGIIYSLEDLESRELAIRWGNSLANLGNVIDRVYGSVNPAVGENIKEDDLSYSSSNDGYLEVRFNDNGNDIYYIVKQKDNTLTSYECTMENGLTTRIIYEPYVEFADKADEPLDEIILEQAADCYDYLADVFNR